jgi:protease-4
MIRSQHSTRAALLLAGLAVLLTGCGNFLSISGPQFKEVLLEGDGSDKLLMIDITGPISNQPLLIPNVGVIPGLTARIRQELELAYDDNNIRGILLRIDSPGGTLTDSDVIYHSLMEFKKTKKVKIVAAMGDIAASGAVYVAMAADEIYAHPTTITGSMGVIMPHMDYSDLANKLGVRSDPVHAGQYKGIGDPLIRRTEPEQKMLQAIVDKQHEKFIKVVQDGRPKLSSQQVRGMADGSVFTAEEAKEKGLIDSIGYLDDAYKRLTQLSGFPKNKLVRYSNTWLTGNNIYTNAFPIELLPN